jgi:hypothetical protein
MGQSTSCCAFLVPYTIVLRYWTQGSLPVSQSLSSHGQEQTLYYAQKQLGGKWHHVTILPCFLTCWDRVCGDIEQREQNREDDAVYRIEMKQREAKRRRLFSARIVQFIGVSMLFLAGGIQFFLCEGFYQQKRKSYIQLRVLFT